MVTVVATVGKGRLSMQVTGHAEYNPGNDIVCAGVSAILFSLLGFLENAKEELRVNDTWSWHSGDVSIDVTETARTEAAFMTAYIGLAQLAQQYPNHVCCEMKKIFYYP